MLEILPEVSPLDFKSVASQVEEKPALKELDEAIEILEKLSTSGLSMSLEKDPDTLHNKLNKVLATAQEALLIIRYSRTSIKTDLTYLIQLRLFFREISQSVFKPKKYETVLTKSMNSRIRSLQDAVSELLHKAHTDKVTGICNRQRFLELFDELLLKYKPKSFSERAKSNSITPAPCTVVFLDLDYFKQVNDLLSHSEGDRVLRKFAQTLFSVFRISSKNAHTNNPSDKKRLSDRQDLGGRFSGDEFVLVVNDIDDELLVEKLQHARDMFRQILLDFSQAQSDIDPKKRKEVLSRVSFSYGVSKISYPNTLSSNEIMHEADLKMYEAKRERKSKQKKIAETR